MQFKGGIDRMEDINREAQDQLRLIYDQHFKDIYYFLVYFTGNSSEAEDLTQEVFIRVIKGLPNFENRSQVKSWIFSIAKNVATDHYRKRKALSFLNINTILNRRLTSADKSPIEQAEQKEDAAILHEGLLKLKPHYRTVIVLRCINDLSVKETSQILKWSESKVKTNYHRGLKILKKHLLSDRSFSYVERWAAR
jgi:RNA polymerase sigma-70 factor, ECF subfamily